MFPAGTHAAAAAVQAAAAAAAGGLLPNHSFAVKDLISSGQDARERKSFGHSQLKKNSTKIFFFSKNIFKNFLFSNYLLNQ